MTNDFFAPPPEMETFVLAAFDRYHRRRRFRKWAGFAAVAAACSLAILWPRAPKVTEAQGEFIRLPYAMPLDPSDQTSVVRMDMPVSALIAAGLPLFAADTGALARADVVVGEDGLARAVRVVSIADSREKTQ